MCRSDVFRQVNFADAPKIAADAGIYIEWGAEAADIKRVRLWEYLARKAQISTDTLFGYLPRSVDVGKRGGVETLRYLLDFTRYTPRDISLLFNEIQQTTTNRKLTGTIVRETADRFASHHLLRDSCRVDRALAKCGSFASQQCTVGYTKTHFQSRRAAASDI
jgi:hypothetical protein